MRPGVETEEWLVCCYLPPLSGLRAQGPGGHDCRRGAGARAWGAGPDLTRKSLNGHR